MRARSGLGGCRTSRQSDSFREYYANLYQEEQPGWQQVRTAFKELKELSIENDFQLRVVLLPELHNLENYTFKREHALLTEFLENEEIQYMDLAPHFITETSPLTLWVARDDAHPNAKAHRLIAEYSYPFLSEKSIK